jgi:hypothetical protein
MPLAFLIAGCLIARPVGDNIADNLPGNISPKAKLPIEAIATIVDGACLIVTHGASSMQNVPELISHVAAVAFAARALGVRALPLAEIRNPIRGSDPFLLQGIYNGPQVQDRPLSPPRARTSPASWLVSPKKPARAARIGRLHRQS